VKAFGMNVIFLNLLSAASLCNGTTKYYVQPPLFLLLLLLVAGEMKIPRKISGLKLDIYHHVDCGLVSRKVMQAA